MLLIKRIESYTIEDWLQPSPSKSLIIIATTCEAFVPLCWAIYRNSSLPVISIYGLVFFKSLIITEEKKKSRENSK